LLLVESGGRSGLDVDPDRLEFGVRRVDHGVRAERDVLLVAGNPQFRSVTPTLTDAGVRRVEDDGKPVLVGDLHLSLDRRALFFHRPGADVLCGRDAGLADRDHLVEGHVRLHRVEQRVGILDADSGRRADSEFRLVEVVPLDRGASVDRVVPEISDILGLDRPVRRPVCPRGNHHHRLAPGESVLLSVRPRQGVGVIVWVDPRQSEQLRREVEIAVE
jgi:hypothetical protein